MEEWNCVLDTVASLVDHIADRSNSYTLWLLEPHRAEVQVCLERHWGTPYGNGLGERSGAFSCVDGFHWSFFSSWWAEHSCASAQCPYLFNYPMKYPLRVAWCSSHRGRGRRGRRRGTLSLLLNVKHRQRVGYAYPLSFFGQSTGQNTVLY